MTDKELVSQPVQPKRCQYCDGTGDVHSIDGQWRGSCNCEAAQLEQELVQGEPVGDCAVGDILGAAYDFRDAHLTGSTNLKRSAHAKLEAAVRKALSVQGEPVAWLQIGLAPYHDGVVIARTGKPEKWDPSWWRFEPLYAHPQPEQTAVPVAWMAPDACSVASDHEKRMGYVLQDAFSVPLYTTPQPERVPLTIQQYNALPCLQGIPPSQFETVVRGIEAAHGIKGGQR